MGDTGVAIGDVCRNPEVIGHAAPPVTSSAAGLPAAAGEESAELRLREIARIPLNGPADPPAQQQRDGDG
jgi:hypothetical protein